TVGRHTTSHSGAHFLYRKNIKIGYMAPMRKTDGLVKVICIFKNWYVSFAHKYLGGSVSKFKSKTSDPPYTIGFLIVIGLRQTHRFKFTVQFFLGNDFPTTTQSLVNGNE